MKYCLFFVTSFIAGIHAFQEQPRPLIRLGFNPGSELECYDTYQDKNKFAQLRDELHETQQHFPPLLALEAWRRLYDDCFFWDEERIFEYEKSIADNIIESMNRGAAIDGVCYKRIFDDRNRSVIIGRHILHYLFAVPRYTMIMRDLWQKIKTRPCQEILNFSGSGKNFDVLEVIMIQTIQRTLASPAETKTFLEVVFEALEEDQPNAMNKLEFLWDYNFLSAEWLQALQNKIMQKCDELPRFRTVKLALGRLLFPYQQRLLNQQNLLTACNHHQQFVDSDIFTQD